MSYPESPAGVWRFGEQAEQAGVVRFLAPGEATNHEFGLFETRVTPGTGAMPHYHQGFSESFYVLSGRVAVLADREWQALSSGDFAHVPAHGVHAFRGLDDEASRLLILFVPAHEARERYFRGLAELGRRDTPATAAEIDEFARSCDQVNLRDWSSGPVPD